MSVLLKSNYLELFGGGEIVFFDIEKDFIFYGFRF